MTRVALALLVACGSSKQSDPAPAPPPAPAALPAEAPADAAIDALPMSEAQEREAALRKLEQLKREQAELRRRLEEHRGGVNKEVLDELHKHPREQRCLDNPLAPGCD